MRVLTFDIEEWFHILDNDSTRSEDEWTRYEIRIHENCERILRILADTNTKATFFCLGWIAEHHPEVVRLIADNGYELATHSHRHQLVYQQTPVDFRQDLERSKKVIEDITGREVRAYRAPGFSVRSDNAWIFNCLVEHGITIDCSVFPTHRAHGGFPNFGVTKPTWIETNSGHLKEFPINTHVVCGKNLIFSGGGYFRLLPYSILRAWTRQSSYLMSYFHPRDFDARQPMIKELSAVRRFKSYYGLGSSEKKLRQLIRDFEFTDLAGADSMVDWIEAPVVSPYRA